MRMPGFWAVGQKSALALLLAPLGWLYGRLTLLRLKRRGTRLPIPVIAVGNFTAGGAGKTPTVLAIARRLEQKGETPFVVSRGYGGTEPGPWLVEAQRELAARVGDEPLMMARRFPVVVARQRAAGGKFAQARGASAVILDDALQNPDLVADFTLAVVDGGFGIGNGLCIPAGPLRAPLAPMLARCDAVLLIGPDATGLGKQLAAKPLFRAALRVEAAAAQAVRQGRVLAFCGIGRPEKFAQSLRECGADLVGLLAYGDHHAYSDEDAATILAEAERLQARLVTTEKDATRLAGSPMLEQLRAAALVVPVRVELPEALAQRLYATIPSARNRSSTASGEA